MDIQLQHLFSIIDSLVTTILAKKYIRFELTNTNVLDSDFKYSIISDRARSHH